METDTLSFAVGWFLGILTWAFWPGVRVTWKAVRYTAADRPAIAARCPYCQFEQRCLAPRHQIALYARACCANCEERFWYTPFQFPVRTLTDDAMTAYMEAIVEGTNWQ